MTDRRYVESEVRKNAGDIGWKGKIQFDWDPRMDMEGFGSGTRARNIIAIVMPKTIDNVDEALEEAMSNFLHAFEHNPSETRMGRWSSSSEEEISTYIRGMPIARKLSFGKRFEELGVHYTTHDLAFARSGGEGISEQDVEKAKDFVRECGFQEAINEIKRIRDAREAVVI